MEDKIVTTADSVHAFANGRVNLLGEHTDYNLGLVLPTTIPQRTEVRLRFRSDRCVHASSTAMENEGLEYELGREARGRGWLDYVQGVTAVLAQQGLVIPGFELRIDSQVPTGSGLSSSAALLTALLRALRQGLALDLPDVELARLCQQIENDFVGAPVGILDPLACGLCLPAHALYLDTRTLAAEQLPLPRTVELVVIHSGISHRLAATAEIAPHGDYRARRAECERAAALCGIPSLRQLEEDDDAKQRIAKLPPVLAARVRHVFSENDRVRKAAGLLRSLMTREVQEADLEELGALFYASHCSQRDDYAVSIPEIDRLVELGAADRDIVHKAARLTGGGFGGSVVMLARRGTASAAAARITAAYKTQTGHNATILVPAA